MNMKEKLLSRILIRPNGCWLWVGANDGDKDPYGRVVVNGKQRMVHRISYETFVGKIPDGLQIDHLCRKRLCINPEHLEPVTPKENIRRGLTGYRTVTHCKRGHKFSETGYYSKSGIKLCRLCKRITAREYYHNHKKKVPA